MGLFDKFDIKRISAVLVIAMIVMTSSGCAQNESHKDATDSQSATVSDSKDTSEKTLNAEDPLLGLDISCPSGWDDGACFAMMADFLETEKSVDASNILMVNANDFDGDGGKEVFVFVSDMGDSGREDRTTGNLWLLTKDGHYKVDGMEDKAWKNLDGILDFGDRAYMYMDETTRMEALSYVWTVENGKAVEAPFSALGIIYPESENEFTITVSDYDESSTEEDGEKFYYGWTFKPYYFYYDANDRSVHEYAAAKVYDITDVFGVNVDELLTDYDIWADDYMYRANGMLTINYSEHDGLDTTYYNFNYDCNKADFINLGIDVPRYASNYGGTYKRFICPEIAVFPTEKDADFVTVSDGDRLVTEGLVVSQEMRDWFEDGKVTYANLEDQWEYSETVCFKAYKTFKDFSVFSADPYFENDRIGYEKHMIYRQSELTPDKILVAYFDFPGDMSANGFSFVDEKGRERSYIITLSGYDGSLYIEEETID